MLEKSKTSPEPVPKSVALPGEQGHLAGLRWGHVKGGSPGDGWGGMAGPQKTQVAAALQ